MSVKTIEAPHSKRPPYVSWRAKELAKLALSRISSWSVTDLSDGGRFDYAVLDVETGASFMIEVKAFSSIHTLHNFEKSATELTHVVSTSLINDAKSMHCPVFLFVFDADTGHGRFRRLDTLQIDDARGDKFHLSLPKENTINAESMKRLAKELPRQ